MLSVKLYERKSFTVDIRKGCPYGKYIIMISCAAGSC